MHNLKLLYFSGVFSTYLNVTDVHYSIFNGSVLLMHMAGTLCAIFGEKMAAYGCYDKVFESNSAGYWARCCD